MALRLRGIHRLVNLQIEDAGVAVRIYFYFLARVEEDTTGVISWHWYYFGVTEADNPRELRDGETELDPFTELQYIQLPSDLQDLPREARPVLFEVARYIGLNQVNID